MSKHCLHPACKSTDILARGLCKTHYFKARRHVAIGTVTWAELEEAGEAARSQGSGKLAPNDGRLKKNKAKRAERIHVAPATRSKRGKRRKACMVPGCQDRARSRGLCMKHYMTVASLVRKGKTTMSKLEKSGKILPHRSNGHQEAVSYFLD